MRQLTPDELRSRLHDEAAGLTVGPAPVHGIVAGSRRRRTRTAVVATVAAVAVVVAGGSVLRTRPEDGRGAITPTGAVMVPPDGMRYVGLRDVVIAVPRSWTTGETTCQQPAEATVYVRSTLPETVDCDPGAISGTSLAVTDLAITPDLAPDPSELGPADPLGGRTVSESAARCSNQLRGGAACTQTVEVPDSRLSLRISVNRDVAGALQLVRRIRGSLRPLSPGQTVVPLEVVTGPGYAYTPVPGIRGDLVDRVARAVTGAGLRADVVQERSTEFDAGAYLGADPPLGTPVPDGSTVTIRQAGGPGPSSATSAPAPPELQRAADRFIAFAEGQRADLPTADSVRLYFGGKLVRALPRARLSDRAAWRGCYDDGFERPCTISPLARLADHPGRLLATPTPRLACDRPSALTAEPGRRVFVTSAEPTGCLDFFAVQLVIDGTGRISAVDLTLGSP